MSLLLVFTALRFIIKLRLAQGLPIDDVLYNVAKTICIAFQNTLHL